MAHRGKASYHSSLIFAFNNAAAFMPLVMLPFGFLARGGLVDGRFYVSDGIFALIVTCYIAVSALWFTYRKKVPQSSGLDICFMVLFHLLTIAFVLFISGFLSAFLSVWVVLMIAADMRFKMMGFLASASSLAFAGMLSVVVFPDMPDNERIEIIQGTIVVTAIGFAIAKIRSITDRERQALAKTREQEVYQRERLLALVNSMGDAVVATDQQGVIKVYNSTLLNLLDTNLNLTGRSIDDIIKLFDSSGKRLKLMNEAHSRRTVFSRTDLSHKFADGEIIKLYINVAPIQPGYRSHAESGYIFIMRDITKEKSLEEERDEFISVVSHELRTPVAIAEGGLSNIVLLQERGAAPEVLKQAAVAAHDQILYLSKLINDLSALSRAERGLGAEMETVDLTNTLHTVFNNYLSQAQAKNLKLNLNIATIRLPKVVSSKLYIEEILQNLVTNALKYTKEGSVTIHAKQSKQGLQLQVADTGIGISKSDQKHMFQKFYRSEDYRTRESSGTGLGLYVCKKLAEKIGLELSFESRLNHGSVFTLSIPPKYFVTGAKSDVQHQQSVQLPGSKHSGLSK